MPVVDPVSPQDPQNDNNNDNDDSLFTPPPPSSDDDSSGGGGGGGGGGLSQAQANHNNQKFFLNTLREFGIRLTPNLQRLVSNAVSNHYNPQAFLFYLRQTKEYHQRFKGIFNKNGTLRMSEAQYLANERHYEDVASRAGLNLNGKQMDWLFLNEVSPSEFANRAEAISRLNRNKDLYEAFKRELVQSGYEKPGNVTRKNILRFILGRGNEKWEDLWNDAVARNAATQAGLAVGKKRAAEFLPQALLERISGLGLSESELAQGFEQVADDIENLIPLSELYGAGLTRSDIVTLRFGGKNRQEIKTKAEEVIASHNLSQEGKANPQLYQTGEGKSTLAYGGLSGEEGE